MKRKNHTLKIWSRLLNILTSSSSTYLLPWWQGRTNSQTGSYWPYVQLKLNLYKRTTPVSILINTFVHWEESKIYMKATTSMYSKTSEEDQMNLTIRMFSISGIKYSVPLRIMHLAQFLVIDHICLLFIHRTNLS